MLSVLANTSNDAIFATAQIKVFVEFMWRLYFTAIFRTMFMPFLVNFISFILYSSWFAHDASSTEVNVSIGEMICIGVYVVSLAYLLVKEAVTFRSMTMWKYFTDPWNILDIISIILNITYTVCELFNYLSGEAINVLGAFCAFLLWMKFFSWMRLFRPLSAFIRMVSEILKDVAVFFQVLMLSLAAFANIIYILNINH